MSTNDAVWLGITLLRLLLPLSIRRWPLGGAIACIIADTYDHTVFRTTGFGPFGPHHYQQWDKLMDLWYLGMLFAVSRHWTDALARRTAGALFWWRLVGVVALELSGWRKILVFAPNILENFYLFWTMSLKWFPFRLTGKRLVLILLAVGIPKIYLEVHLHWLYPDQDFWRPLRRLLEKY